MQYYFCRKNSSNVNFADKKSLRIFLEENFAPMVEEAISKFMDSEIYDKGQTYTTQSAGGFVWKEKKEKTNDQV